MKKLLLALFALAMVIADIPTANAVVCARGVYRAGCVGARGAVVTHRPAARGYYHRHVRVYR